MTKITIKGELTDLNTFINATNRNKFVGASVKKRETERVYWEAVEQKIAPITQYPVYVRFHWHCKNTRKDLDNIVFAKKFILDGLVMAKVLEDDSYKFVNSFEDRFFVDKDNPRVEIQII